MAQNQAITSLLKYHWTFKSESARRLASRPPTWKLTIRWNVYLNELIISSKYVLSDPYSDSGACAVIVTSTFPAPPPACFRVKIVWKCVFGIDSVQRGAEIESQLRGQE